VKWFIIPASTASQQTAGTRIASAKFPPKNPMNPQVLKKKGRQTPGKSATASPSGPETGRHAAPHCPAAAGVPANPA